MGSYTIGAAGADSGNYDPTYETGVLFIADIEVTLPTTEIVDDRPVLTSDRKVTCNCQGLKPGETVTLTIYSEPTQIVTGTVPADGTCPFAKLATIPTNVPDGDHTLELSSTFVDTDGVKLLTPLTLETQSGEVPPGGGDSISVDPPADVPPPAQSARAPVQPALGGLSITGTRLMGILGLAVALSLSGFFVFAASRRRRRV